MSTPVRLVFDLGRQQVSLTLEEIDQINAQARELAKQMALCFARAGTLREKIDDLTGILADTPDEDHDLEAGGRIEIPIQAEEPAKAEAPKPADAPTNAKGMSYDDALVFHYNRLGNVNSVSALMRFHRDSLSHDTSSQGVRARLREMGFEVPDPQQKGGRPKKAVNAAPAPKPEPVAVPVTSETPKAPKAPEKAAERKSAPTPMPVRLEWEKDRFPVMGAALPEKPTEPLPVPTLTYLSPEGWPAPPSHISPQGVVSILDDLVEGQPFEFAGYHAEGALKHRDLTETYAREIARLGWVERFNQLTPFAQKQFKSDLLQMLVKPEAKRRAG